MADASPHAVVDGDTCALSPEEFEMRVREWRALANEALTRTAEPGRVISSYPATEDIRRRLLMLIEAEARCCSFLEFDMRDRDGAIEVELRYPAGFDSVLELVLPEPTSGGPQARPG
jgi:hypothetical protein